MYRLFVVEDDPKLAESIKDNAESWDIQVSIAYDLHNIMKEFVSVQPHLVLMDISLPFFNGYHWCCEIRKVSKVPIIFISSMSDNMNIVMAMDLGADDFIVKPFDGDVMMSKVRAMLRRTYDFFLGSPYLEHRGAFLDTGSGTLTYGEGKIELTKNEYRILLCLMENKNKVVSREKLMERLWKTDIFIDENTLTVNINRLRKKLETAGLENFITTKIGVGYMIE